MIYSYICWTCSRTKHNLVELSFLAYLKHKYILNHEAWRAWFADE